MGQYYNSISYGAAIQNINTEIIRNSKIVLPEQKILKQFSSAILNIDKMTKVLLTQSQNLARQRDLLLTRLMSGKLEVKHDFRKFHTEAQRSQRIFSDKLSY